jgi:hypothetical protein
VATSYLNTGGAGNRTASIRAFDNGVVGGGGLTPTKLIDGTKTDQGWFNSGFTTAWIEFDFSAIGKVIIDAFKIYGSAATANGTWKLSGWNETTGAWVTLLASFTWAGNAAGFGTPNEVTFVNSTAYAVYRFDQIAGTTTSSPDYSEVEFKIETSTTSRWQWATGDRQASITASGGASTFAGGLTGPRLVDGSIVNTQGWLNSGQSASNLDFDFLGVSKILQGFAWFQESTTANGTWKVQGWNGSAYVDVATGLVLKGAGSAISVAERSYRFANSTGYTKYRLAANRRLDGFAEPRGE